MRSLLWVLVFYCFQSFSKTVVAVLPIVLHNNQWLLGLTSWFLVGTFGIWHKPNCSLCSFVVSGWWTRRRSHCSSLQMKSFTLGSLRCCSSSCHPGQEIKNWTALRHLWSNQTLYRRVCGIDWNYFHLLCMGLTYFNDYIFYSSLYKLIFNSSIV